jgi:cytochrome c-type biogenesis protein CcmH
MAVMLLVIVGVGTAARAIQPGEMLADPALEARARDIGRDLRCLVCQNQSIDDSDADLAHDLRMLVRQRLLAGDTNQQALNYIVVRYGDYVLLKPPFKGETLALWLGPLALLLAAVWVARSFYRHRMVAKDMPPLTEAESQRLNRLITDTNSE